MAYYIVFVQSARHASHGRTICSVTLVITNFCVSVESSVIALFKSNFKMIRRPFPFYATYYSAEIREINLISRITGNYASVIIAFFDFKFFKRIVTSASSYDTAHAVAAGITYMTSNRSIVFALFDRACIVFAFNGIGAISTYQSAKINSSCYVAVIFTIFNFSSYRITGYSDKSAYPCLLCNYRRVIYAVFQSCIFAFSDDSARFGFNISSYVVIFAEIHIIMAIFYNSLCFSTIGKT